MSTRIDIKISEQPLSQEDCFDFVSDASVGGICVFVGTVRNHTQNKEVLKLDFSSYTPMALKEMKIIAEQCCDEFDIFKISMHHAIGELAIGDVPVVIAVSASHRGDAFSACQFAIDRLKETVPIWKKEYFHDGEVWVNAHP